MAATTRRQKRRPSPPLINHPLAQQLPLVSPRWLLWCLGGIFGGGLALVYFTMCLLFWQGQWQILFHPTHTIDQTPAANGIPFEDVHFAATQTGQPRLDGWFIPAGTEADYQDLTILYLHGMQQGSLAATLPPLKTLHQLGINIFAFDYRGFGRSQDLHPSEESVSDDTESAWDYLVNTRHVPAHSIVIYGEGLGASLAATAAAHHSDSAGVVLDTPAPAGLELLRADPRSRWMPMRLLAHDRFNPQPALAEMKVPKLFLLPSSSANIAGERYARQAADPKLTVTLPAENSPGYRLEALRRFLDESSPNRP